MGSVGWNLSNNISSVLGLTEPSDLSKEVQSNLKAAFQRREELSDKLTKLNEELDKETIRDNNPEIKELGRTLASLFDSYTEKGEEIRKEIRAIREQKDEIERRIQQYSETLRAEDNKLFESQQVIWKNNRPKLVDISTREYRGFSLDSATSSIQDALARNDAILVEMSPREYLQRVSYDIFRTNIERTVRGTDIANIKKYAKMMKRGTKFYTPWLDYVNKGQEGRHRALAAILNGYTKIPVVVRLR